MQAASLPVGRQQRLKINLMIGFLMAVMVVTGYTLLGPGDTASAAGMANHQLVNVSPNGGLPDQQNSDMIMTSDMIALHAEMDEITQKMNALKGVDVPANMSYRTGNNQSVPTQVIYETTSNQNGMVSTNYDQVQSALEQMMAITHDMMAKMESMQNMPGAVSSTTNTGGHH